MTAIGSSRSLKVTDFVIDRPGFIEEMTKKHLVLFRFTFPVAIHLQNATVKFNKVV